MSTRDKEGELQRLAQISLAILGALALAAQPSQKPSDSAQTPPKLPHLLLLIEKTDTGFRLLQTTRVESTLPKNRGPRGHHSWQAQVTDQAGKVLFEVGLDDPKIVRGEFVDPQDPSRIQAVRVVQPGPLVFSVRVPIVAGQTLSFFENPSCPESSPAAPPPPPVKLGEISYPADKDGRASD